MNQLTNWLKPSRIVIAVIALPLAALSIGHLVQGRSLKKHLAAIRAEGYPVSLEEFDLWYPYVDPKENAALIFTEAASLTRKPVENDPDLPGVGRSPWPLPDTPIPSETRAAIRDHVAKNTEALTTAHKAARLPRSRYPIDLRQGFNTLLPHLAEVKKLTQLLRLETTHHVVEGNVAPALRAAHTGFAAAHSLVGEPLLISELVRIACVAITVPSLELLLGNHPLDDEQLRLLIARLDQAEADSIPSFRRAMAGERAGGISCFQLSPAELGPLLGASGAPGFPQALLILNRVTGLHARDFQIYLRAFDRIQAAALLPPTEAQSEMDRGFQEATDELNSLLGRFMIITKSVLPAISGAYQKESRIIAQLRTARTALVIERYRLQQQGNLPESLDQLVPAYLDAVPIDPADGQPLLLERLEKGFRVTAQASTAQFSKRPNANQSSTSVGFSVTR